MEIQRHPRKSKDIHGNRRISTQIHGNPVTSMAIHGNPRTSTEIQRNPRTSVEIQKIHGNLGNTKKSNKYQQNTKQIYGMPPRGRRISSPGAQAARYLENGNVFSRYFSLFLMYLNILFYIILQGNLYKQHIHLYKNSYIWIFIKIACDCL